MGVAPLTDITQALSTIAGQTKVATRLDELANAYKLDLFTEARGKKFFDLPKEQSE